MYDGLSHVHAAAPARSGLGVASAVQQASADAGTMCTRLQVVPILRAGLVLLEQAGTVLPMSETYHVGYVRDEETLQASGGGHFSARALSLPCAICSRAHSLEGGGG